MSAEYKLSYTASEIDEKLAMVDTLATITNQSNCLNAAHNQVFKHISHRGYYVADSLAQNSIEALKASVLNGYNFIECDISITGYKSDFNAETDNLLDAERQIIVKHDISFTGEDGVKTYYANLPYSQCGKPVLFKDFLNQAKAIGAYLYLDIKQIDKDILGWGKEGDTTSENIVNSYLRPIVETVENAGMMNNVTFMAARTAYLSYIVSSNWLNRNNCRIAYVSESASTSSGESVDASYVINAINGLKAENETSMLFLNMAFNNFTNELYEAIVSEGIDLEVWASSNYTEDDIQEIIAQYPKLKGITYNIPRGLVDKMGEAIINRFPAWQGGSY